MGFPNVTPRAFEQGYKRHTMKEEYDKLRKKYTLPEFDKLDKEFEISTMEEEGFILANIRRKMTDKIEQFAKVLEGLLHPEADLAGLNECRVFHDQAQMEELFDLYKKLMISHRESLIVGIKGDEKETAAYITSTFSDWEKVKESMIKILKKMKSAWKEDISPKEILDYLG
jgi:hypothetical protein